ncbi:MAG: hypothetical protein R3C02_06480 [Planctomycetaceae bacterium]
MTDEDLLSGVHELATQQGIYACPEGAVWRACTSNSQPTAGCLPKGIVLFNTGTGLKYNHLFPWVIFETRPH